MIHREPGDATVPRVPEGTKFPSPTDADARRAATLRMIDWYQTGPGRRERVLWVLERLEAGDLLETVLNGAGWTADELRDALRAERIRMPRENARGLLRKAMQKGRRKTA